MDQPVLPLPPAVQKGFRLVCLVSLIFLLTSLLGDVSRTVWGRDHLYGLIPLFNLRVEGNLPTFFHALLLLGSASTAALISRAPVEDRYLARRWLLIAVVFAYLAVDEAAGVHEILNAPLRDALGATGFFYFPWVIPYFALVVLFAAANWRFLHRLAPWYRHRVVASAFVYVIGALGMEVLQGARYTAHGPDETYFIIWLTGETLETIGLLLFGYTLLNYLLMSRKQSA